VFDSASGNGVDTIAVPGFYTYAGFQRSLIEKLPTIAEQLQRDSWVLGNVGQQDVIQKQFDDLTRDILARYSKDFVDQWKGTLEKLRIRPLNAGKPNYETLVAAAAPTSPIRLLMESIRDESVLTRERKDGKSGGNDAKKDPPAGPLLSAQGISPGAYIEAQFKPFHQAVEGDGVRVILGDLTAIITSLQTMVYNPTQEQQATAALRNQVAQLKTDAPRIPSPFSKMLLQSANSFDDAIANDLYQQISRDYRNLVSGACKDLVLNRYPLVRGAREEIPLVEFGKLFGVNGIFDDFFRKNLQSYADTTNPREWKWLDNPVARHMSADTLHQFQRAAQIRDAFFSGNPGYPSVTLTVTPPFLGPDSVAKLEINGFAVTSSNQPNPAAVQVQWPSAGGRTAVSLSVPGAQPSEQLPRPSNSQWALFRLFDQVSSKSARGNVITAAWVVGGRDVPFTFATGTQYNPLQLPALTEFKCPGIL
jgi:type VI secretion system protein ImpL